MASNLRKEWNEKYPPSVDEVLSIIKNEIIPESDSEPILPKKIKDLKAACEDRWLEYTTAADLGAADKLDRLQAYEDASDAYVEACDSFRENPQPWWDEQEYDDAAATIEGLR